MDPHDKALYARVLFRSAKDQTLRSKPDAVPEGVIKLHDEVEELNRWFSTKTRLDLDQFWLITKLADMRDTIDALKDRLAAVEAKAAAEPEADESIEESKPDMRTREGRALKAKALAGVA